MGYRSDVAYTIRFRNKQVANEYIALVMFKSEANAKALGECQIEDEAESGVAINFYNPDVKWYEGDFREVDAHLENLDLVDDRFAEDAGYRFVRIGEEIDDNTDRTGGNSEFIEWDLNINRHIDTPFNAEYEPIGDKLGLIA